MNIEIIEAKEAQEDYARFVVQVTKLPELAESALRYNKITVIASPAKQMIDVATGGLFINLSVPLDLIPYVVADELDELSNFVGTIQLHNDLSRLEEIFKLAERYGMSLIFTSGASQYVLENHIDLPNEKLYCWLTHSDFVLTDQQIAFAQKNNVGLMLNQAKDARLLYGISQMIAFPGRVVASNAITNDNLGGVTLVEQAHLLAENGISCWIKSHQKTYPFSLFLGKVQAYAKYYDAIIEHEVREAVASFISQGRTMGQLEILRNVIASSLARFLDQLEEAMEIEIPRLESMSSANRQAGIVDFVQIRYRLLGELRTINIII